MESMAFGTLAAVAVTAMLPRQCSISFEGGHASTQFGTLELETANHSSIPHRSLRTLDFALRHEMPLNTEQYLSTLPKSERTSLTDTLETVVSAGPQITTPLGSLQYLQYAQSLHILDPARYAAHAQTIGSFFDSFLNSLTRNNQTIDNQ